MTSQILHLLQQIASGITIYEPLRRTGAEMVEFQDTVERLLEMHRLGLVGRIHTEVRSIAGAEDYNMAMVQGGLTAEGERLLAQHRRTVTEKGVATSTSAVSTSDATSKGHR